MQFLQKLRSFLFFSFNFIISSFSTFFPQCSQTILFLGFLFSSSFMNFPFFILLQEYLKSFPATFEVFQSASYNNLY